MRNSKISKPSTPSKKAQILQISKLEQKQNNYPGKLPRVSQKLNQKPEIAKNLREFGRRLSKNIKNYHQPQSSCFKPKQIDNFGRKYIEQNLQRQKSHLTLNVRNQLKGFKKKYFIYYISQIRSDWEKFIKKKCPQKQIQSIFINHLIHVMYIYKSKKFQTPPLKPHLSIKLQNISFEKTIFFDLDQTLLHSQSWQNCKFYPHQKQIFVQQKSGKIKNFQVNIRPHALQVINRLKTKFNLAVFTASDRAYATKILDILDPHQNIFKNRFYRQHCYLNFNQENIKDLRIFTNLDPKKIVIVDNSPVAYSFQKNNAIPIIPFTDDSEDDQLLKLQKFLNQSILQSRNLQKTIADIFKSEQLHKYQTVKQTMNILNME